MKGNMRAMTRSPSYLGGLARAGTGLTALGLVMALAGAASASPLETVTVQARGVEESVRDIPVAITAVDQQKMEDFSLTNLEDIAQFTPSLEILRILSGTGTSISIRGISSSAGSLGIEQSVAVIIDGVYFPQGRVINEGMYDVSQVAILKGPQALYFGKNATAGVISIQTNDPGDEFEALARVGYEIEAESLEGEAMISFPINDKWGLRLAAQGTKMFGGYYTNTAGDSIYTTTDVATGIVTQHVSEAPSDRKLPGEETISARLTLKGELSDRFTARLKASFADSTLNAPGLFELVECRTLNGTPHRSVGTAPNQMPVPAGAGECNKDRNTGFNNWSTDIAEATPGGNRFGDGQLGELYKSYIVTADLTYTLDWLNIQGVFNYHRQKNAWVGDNDGGADFSVFAQEFNTFSNYSAEIRAATTFDGPLNATLGFYYQDTHRYFDQSVHFAGAENSAADPSNRYVAYDKVSETDGETVSVYGELKWSIIDELTLTGGARYLWERKDSYFIQPYVNPNFLGLFVENRLLEADQKNDDLIPEVTLTWQPTDILTLYVAYKQGFKSAGFDNGAIDSTLNASPLDDITFEPETVEGIEGGVKALLLDGTLNLELDAYTYKFNDLQLNFFNSPTFAYVTLNAGGARTTGAELQATWQPASVDGLTLTGSVAYNDAHYTDFVAPCSGGQSPAEGCTGGMGGLRTQQLAGEPRNLAPKWSGNMGFDFNRPFGNGLMWGISGNMKWKSKYSLSEFIPSSVQKGYASFDASLRIGSADGTWQVAVIGKNLTDEYVLVGTRDAASTGGNTGTANAFPSDLTGYALPPRTVKFEFTYRY